MGKSHPIALRSWVVAFVEEGHSHREASSHFRVSPRFVNNLVILKRENSSLAPRRQAHLGCGKLGKCENRDVAGLAASTVQGGGLTDF
jgi:hypothetical protein